MMVDQCLRQSLIKLEFLTAGIPLINFSHKSFFFLTDYRIFLRWNFSSVVVAVVGQNSRQRQQTPTSSQRNFKSQKYFQKEFFFTIGMCGRPKPRRLVENNSSEKKFPFDKTGP